MHHHGLPACLTSQLGSQPNQQMTRWHYVKTWATLPRLLSLPPSLCQGSWFMWRKDVPLHLTTGTQNTRPFFLLFWCHLDENMGFPRRHGSKEKIGHGYDPLPNPRRNRVSELKKGLVLNPISFQYQSATLAVSKNKNNNNNILD